MAEIVIKLSNEASAQAEKHAKELGYEDAADWWFELGRNHTAEREDRLYTRCHIGEHNQTFGRSRREARDLKKREDQAAKEAAEAKRAAAENKAKE